jgi:hypothetical protein
MRSAWTGLCTAASALRAVACDLLGAVPREEAARHLDDALRVQRHALGRDFEHLAGAWAAEARRLRDEVSEYRSGVRTAWGALVALIAQDQKQDLLAGDQILQAAQDMADAVNAEPRRSTKEGA